MGVTRPPWRRVRGISVRVRPPAAIQFRPFRAVAVVATLGPRGLPGAVLYRPFRAKTSPGHKPEDRPVNTYRVSIEGEPHSFLSRSIRIFKIKCQSRPWRAPGAQSIASSTQHINAY